MTYDHRSTTIHRADLDREIDTLRTERLIAAIDGDHPGLDRPRPTRHRPSADRRRHRPGGPRRRDAQDPSGLTGRASGRRGPTMRWMTDPGTRPVPGPRPAPARPDVAAAPVAPPDRAAGDPLGPPAGSRERGESLDPLVARRAAGAGTELEPLRLRHADRA